MLNVALKVIVSFEKHHTTNKRDGSLCANIFVASFMNTAFIALVVNADVTYFIARLKFLGKNGLRLLTGEYRDLTSRWYPHAPPLPRTYAQTHCV